MKKDDLLIEEFRSLRGQIDYQVKDIRDLERYSVVAVAIIFSWLAANSLAIQQVPLMWFLPMLIPIMAWIRSNAIANKISELSKIYK